MLPGATLCLFTEYWGFLTTEYRLPLRKALHPADNLSMQGRTRLRGGHNDAPERGAALVEFTMILPLLITLLFGAIDSGFALNDAGKLRQLVRQSTQLAATHTYGTKDTCALSLTKPNSPSAAQTESYRLFCRSRFYGADAGLSVRTAVRVVRFDEDGIPHADSYAQGNAIMVCQEAKTSSRTGLLRPVFDGRLLTSSLTMRIQESDFTVGPTDAEENPFSGDWSWCTPKARNQ